MISNDVAIVTGASQGVGRALAIGLAREGFKVAAMARSTDRLSSIAAEAGVPAASVLPIKLDLSNPQSIVDAVRCIPKEFGRLQVVVNNAGEGGAGTLDVQLDKLTSLLNVNLVGPFKLLQEVVPILVAEQSGIVINIASRAGKIGFAGWGAYGASKFGLVGLSESLYRELAAFGVKVTTICPGWIDTEMAKRGGSPLASSDMIQPEDLMKTVRWLMSLSPAACVREVVIECRDDIE
jgi:NAD(P)-dependent dehydrogenase (short-subunit alcohol dehydrogenase family)